MDEKTEGQLRVIRKVIAVMQAADISAWLFGGCGLDARIGRDWMRVAVEFRHASWHCQETFALLTAHGVAYCRDQPQEVGQPGVIARLRRRELDQQHRPPVAQLVPARGDALQPRLWCVQPAPMGQAPGRLDRQAEAARQSVPPAAEPSSPPATPC